MAKDKDTTFADRIKYLDFYKDLPKDMAEPTVSGASVSMFVVALMGALFLSEVVTFMNYQKTSEIVIDVSAGSEKLNINMNITLPNVPCHILSLDIVDVTGVHIVDVGGELHKHRLDKNGNFISRKDVLEEKTSLQMNEKQTNTIFKETWNALENQEGCLVEGYVIINKVPGNFHLSTHSFAEVVQKIYMSGRTLDFTHTINHLSFGDDKQMKEIQSRFGESFNFDLDGTFIEQRKHLYQGQMLANYYLDVNEVEYKDKTNSLETRQLQGFKHKSSRSLLAQMGLPAIFFRYELSPIKLQYTVFYKQWSAFLIQICAIIGGLFSVAGIIEAALRNSINLVKTHPNKR